MFVANARKKVVNFFGEPGIARSQLFQPFTTAMDTASRNPSDLLC
jgi:hypothetical protein